jgi:hypothetical protein
MNEIKINIPTNVNELNLSQFVKLQHYAKTNNNQQLTDEFEIISNVAEIFGITKDQIRQLEIKSFYRLSEAITDFLKSVETDLGKESYSKDKSFMINGEKYIIDFDLDNGSYGKFTDFLHTLKGNYPDYLPQLLAILIRPENKKTKKIIDYNETELPERIQLFNDNLTVKDFYPIIVFFSLFGNELQNLNIRRSLIQMRKQMNTQKRKQKTVKHLE